MDTARLKAEALNNSRPLDVWRVSAYPEAQSAIDPIYREIVDEGLVKKSGTPGSGGTPHGLWFWIFTWPTFPIPPSLHREGLLNMNPLSPPA